MSELFNCLFEYWLWGHFTGSVNLDQMKFFISRKLHSLDFEDEPVKMDWFEAGHGSEFVG